MNIFDCPSKIYPDGSEGHYTCGCHTCGGRFIGHKRDPMCQACVDKLPAQLELSLEPMEDPFTKQEGKHWR